MKKLVSACLFGFVAATMLFGGEAAAKQLALNLLLTGIVLAIIAIAIVFLAAIAVAISPESAAVIFAVFPSIGAKKPVSKKQAATVSTVTANTSEWSDSHINYDNYEIPTYLRRGYDRGAL